MSLHWYFVELEHSPCGGYGCRGYVTTDIVAAEDADAAIRRVDDAEADRARAWALDLPDLTRRRNPFVYQPNARHDAYRPATWETLTPTEG